LFDVLKELMHQLKKIYFRMVKKIAAAEHSEQVGKSKKSDNGQDDNYGNFFLTHNASLV
jgi:hypothetical protein